MLLMLLTVTVTLADPWICPGCGEENSLNFCGRCGQPSPTPAPVTTPAARTSYLSDRSAFLVGNYVTFGHFPQSRTGGDQTPVEWLVLTVRDGQALLLSRYGLDLQYYDPSGDAVSWKDSGVRGWLNGYFLSQLLTPDEQKAVIQTRLYNDWTEGIQNFMYDGPNGGDETTDSVFLLSCGDAYRYLGISQRWNYQGKNESSNKNARVTATEYALSKASDKTERTDTVLTEAWWLRSPGDLNSTEAYINADGGLGFDFSFATMVLIRPALWVDLNAGVF